MRILYHHRTASRDGQAVHIEEMIGALRELGHEVRVVAPAGAADGATRAGAMGGQAGWVARLKSLMPQALYELAELGYSLVAYRKLARAVREFRPDVVYERYNLYLVAGALLRKRFGLPLLLEVNAPLVEERLKHSGGLALPRLATWAERYAWQQADFVLPVTQVLAHHVMARGVPAERIAVVPNGIQRAHFDSAPPAPEAKRRLGLEGYQVLGFTGFVRDWHGVDRVIRWMATAAAPANAFLLVVGDGPVRAELEALAASLGVAQRVRFTGVVQRDQVPAHVAAFDVALQPAVTAYASPLKLMEYLVLGKAVIAPAVPNIQEVLSHEGNAWLFEEQQAGDFERGLSRLCTDAELRARLAQAAHATIDRLGLTWRRNAQRAVDLARQAGAQA